MKVLTKLKHKRIVTFFGSDEMPEDPTTGGKILYIYTEYMPGVSLHQNVIILKNVASSLLLILLVCVSSPFYSHLHGHFGGIFIYLCVFCIYIGICGEAHTNVWCTKFRTVTDVHYTTS